MNGIERRLRVLFFRASYSMLIPLLLILSTSAHAGTFTAFGPKTFVRDSGKPVVETASINIKNPNTTYTLKIYNGGINSEYSKVSSAIIKLNGSTLFDTGDFNQQISFLQKQVNLYNSSQLQVELRSAPGSGLTIIIEGEDSDPPLVAITSPVNGLYTNTQSVAVSGIASDATTWASNVIVNGKTATLTGETYTSNIQLTEGQNTITARATDAAENTGTVAVSVVLDTIPPMIAIDPVPSLTNKPQITITGKIEDASPISSITVNGGPVGLISNTFTAIVNLTEGNNSVAIDATDRAGNIGTATTSIILDTIQPHLTINSPADKTTINTRSISITGTATDALSGVSSVTVNGINANMRNGLYTADINLVEGPNVVTVTATDAAGNTTISKITVYRDTTPPVITITSPANGSTATTSKVTVTGTIDDNAATVTVNGTAATVSNSTFTSQSIDLIKGANTINIVATDKAGNISLNTLGLIYVLPSQEPPVITINSPIDGSIYSFNLVLLMQNRHMLSGSIIYENTNGFNCGVGYADVSSDINPWGMNIPRTMNVPLTIKTISGKQICGFDLDISFMLFDMMFIVDPYTIGPRTIAVSATDSAGKTGSSKLTIYFDNTPPTISIKAPLDNSTVNTHKINVSGTVDDNNAAVTVNSFNNYAAATVNGINATVANNSFTALDVPLSEGYNVISVTATDLAGNTRGSSVTVYRDTTAPTISVTGLLSGSSAIYQANGSIVATNTIKVFGTIDDNSATVTVNGLNVEVNSHSFMSSGIPLVEGLNTISITAIDIVGNTRSTSITITLDTAAPTVTGTAPSFNATDVPLDSAITATFSEALKTSTISTNTFTLSNSNGTVSGTVSYSGNTITFKPTTQLKRDAVYTGTIKGGNSGVKDLAGNVLATDYTWLFKTKTMPVELSITDPQDGTIINKATALIKGTIKSQSTDFGITVNGVPAEVNGGIWAAQAPLQTGQNAIVATATDSSGNTDKQTITINTQAIHQPVRITTNPQSGIAPLNTRLSIDTSINNPIVSYRIDFEGDGVADLEITTPQEISHTYDIQGLYFPTITIIDSWGYTYTETTTLNVLDKIQMDALLKAKWEGMKGALGSGDATKAVSYFDDSLKNKFTRVFSDLGSDLPSITASLEDITLVSFTGELATYAIGRNQDGNRYIYFIYFMKDKDGIWKIKEM